MNRGFLLSLAMLLTAMLTGCGKSGDAPTASVPATGGAPQATENTRPTSAAPAEQPDAIVVSFLESLRSGNDTLASTLLTQKAREETQKVGLKVQPPGTPDMKYEIGTTEFVTETKDGAHVGSVWSLNSPEGQSENFSVIWVMRLETAGWRIAGMAVPGGTGEEPIFFNFEDAEVLKSYSEGGLEMAENESEPTEPAPSTQLQPRQDNFENAATDANGNPLR